MFGFLFRGFLFLSVVTTYTFSVWNLICKHFIEEFNRHINVHNKNSTELRYVFNKTDSEENCTIANYFESILNDFYVTNNVTNICKK